MNIFLKNAVFKGTMILTFAGIASRIIGFYYRIFLTRQIGAEGIGLFHLVSPVFGICFALCSAGIQTAISRFCAAKENKGSFLFGGLLLSIPLSLIFSFYVYVYADFIACRILLNGDAAPLLKVLCFTFPFATFHNCVNGYYFGKKKAGLPAFSQLFEQTARVGTVYLYAYSCRAAGEPITVMCAVYGNVLGELASTAICAIALLFEHNYHTSFHTIRKCTKKIFTFAFPLTANKLLMHLLQSGESILIPAQLLLYGHSKSEALSIYGVLMGMALPLILFPSAITNSMSVMLLPEISHAQSQKNNTHIMHTINRSVEICMMIGIMSSLLFIVYGANMGSIIFDEPLVKWFVQILAWLCPFYYLTTTLEGILNGLGRTTLTCLHNIAGILIRIAVLILLVPSYGIQGYLIGLLFSQIFVCGCHFYCIQKMFHTGINTKHHVVLPSVISICTILISFALYIPIKMLNLGTPLIQLFCGACTAGILFLICFKHFSSFT